MQGYTEYAKYYDGVEKLKEDAEVVVLDKVIDAESTGILFKETVEELNLVGNKGREL